ncbi:MAG: hypothetical protein A3I06_00175 [Candidatus Lindowbacteria bacterium RIFCSPLOWO2_02_FULL_62_12]|nr:MAG: hypothetical protein A3I06_00175 [Candidatus Lindowbacteria bacterium RIFCSPLOWO2_02_FULL_62_12]
MLARNVIFVDLALAQISALGYAVAFLQGYDPHSIQAYALSLAFTVGGAALFALSRMRKSGQPQEAFIGVIFVVAGAAAVLVLDKAPHGAEHLKELLEGSIVWVRSGEVIKIAAIYAAISLIHFAFRRPFFEITFQPDEAGRRGLRIRWWDFLFYATFGIVVTSSVQVAGVLLVFTFLIVPALISSLFFDRFRTRLLFGWSLSFALSLLGLWLSYDRPSGPMIITLMGAALLAAAIVRQRRGPA